MSISKGIQKTKQENTRKSVPLLYLCKKVFAAMAFYGRAEKQSTLGRGIGRTGCILWCKDF